MDNTICLTSAYLAPVSYYAHLYACRRALLEQCDHYVKQTYRNRCEIASASGRLSLTIPVESNGHEKCAMKDVQISDHGNWSHVHWEALVSAYDNSPYFFYYADEFRPFYEKRFKFLLDFNEQLQEKILELIDLRPILEKTTEYFRAEAQKEVLDLREIIHPKRTISADGGFTPVVYHQVFERENGFLSNLSIVDLLFNLGPESLLVLRDCAKPREETNDK